MKNENQQCVTCSYFNSNVKKCKSCPSLGSKRTNHSANEINELKTNPLFRIQQSLNGIELYDIKMDYHKLRDFLELEFKDHHEWAAFDHKFFISDSKVGRHETMRIVNAFLSSAYR